MSNNTEVSPPKEAAPAESKPSEATSIDSNPSEVKSNNEVSPPKEDQVKNNQTSTDAPDATEEKEQPQEETAAVESKPILGALPPAVNPEETKPSEPTSLNSKPTDIKSNSESAIVTNPQDVKSTETTAANARSTEAAPLDVKPIEDDKPKIISNPHEEKTNEGTPLNSKPTEMKEAAPSDTPGKEQPKKTGTNNKETEGKTQLEQSSDKDAENTKGARKLGTVQGQTENNVGKYLINWNILVLILPFFTILDAPVGASTDTVGRKDTTILLGLVGAVVGVALVAYGYNLYKKKKRNTERIARNGSLNTSDVEEGREMKPLMKNGEQNTRIPLKDETTDLKS